MSIQAEIITIIEERYHHPGPFEEFVERLLALGVIRQTYDAVNDELLFYSADRLLLKLLVKELKGYSNPGPYIFAEKFAPRKLEEALADFDKGKISPNEFHRQLTASGIVYVSVYLLNKKIYYLSQDGHFYLEFF